jgi:tetratricopeptide (TPR) repeat protein
MALLATLVLGIGTVGAQAQGADDLDGLHGQVSQLYSQGKYAEALPIAERCVVLARQRYGEAHPEFGAAIAWMGYVLVAQGRTAEAEPLYRRALGITEKALGPEHPEVGAALNNLAELYRSQGRYVDADPLFRRSLGIREKALGPEHADVGRALQSLADLYRSQGRYAEAEPLYQRALAITEKVLGPEDPFVGTSLNNLALLYQSQGRTAEAEPLFRRSLLIWEKALGPEHPNVGTALNNLAYLYFVQRQWAQAADPWRRSAALTVRRMQRGTTATETLSGKGRSEADQVGDRFYGLVKLVHRLASGPRGLDRGLPGIGKGPESSETFATAQWAHGSEAAASIAQMAARGAKGDPSLATIVRERQDLVAEWQRLDGLRTAAVSQAPGKRDHAAEAANVIRIAAIDKRIADIDKRLAMDFPDYAALSRPKPLSVEEVQLQLRPDEALVLFLDTRKWPTTPEETFIWVVTKTEARWVRSDLGTQALTREVAALRCGLDAAAWENEGGR